MPQKKPNIFIDIKYFLIGIYRERRIIWELAKRDHQKSNKGSYLGFFWAYIQPLMFICIIWLLFGIGFRKGGGTDVPFLLYLITGMTSWHFFAENSSSIVNIVDNYSFLLNRVDFSMGMLPIARLISSLTNHSVFLVMSVIIGIFYGFNPGWYLFQLFYYFFAMTFLIIGIGWITSSTSLFIKDIQNLVKIIIQFGFWLTPIFWQLEKIPEQFHWILKLNPMVYIVMGYRDSFYNDIGFWSKPYDTAYFWLLTIVLLVIGSIVFRRLRPHFSDVI
jgi:ABC-type polysaccharide/polyol phosphate export permease